MIQKKITIFKRYTSPPADGHGFLTVKLDGECVCLIRSQFGKHANMYRWSAPKSFTVIGLSREHSRITANIAAEIGALRLEHLRDVEYHVRKHLRGLR